jgi:hypothetical protein
VISNLFEKEFQKLIRGRSNRMSGRYSTNSARVEFKMIFYKSLQPSIVETIRTNGIIRGVVPSTLFLFQKPLRETQTHPQQNSTYIREFPLQGPVSPVTYPRRLLIATVRSA